MKKSRCESYEQIEMNRQSDKDIPKITVGNDSWEIQLGNIVQSQNYTHK
ncbi:MAG: hypothetical protein M0T78_12505 [Actinomycetota bacterium]|nr:hypothetical protein [Actinomycetota bacterium]